MLSWTTCLQQGIRQADARKECMDIQPSPFRLTLRQQLQVQWSIDSNTFPPEVWSLAEGTHLATQPRGVDSAATRTTKVQSSKVLPQCLGETTHTGTVPKKTSSKTWIEYYLHMSQMVFEIKIAARSSRRGITSDSYRHVHVRVHVHGISIDASDRDRRDVDQIASDLRVRGSELDRAYSCTAAFSRGFSPSKTWLPVGMKIFVCCSIFISFNFTSVVYAHGSSLGRVLVNIVTEQQNYPGPGDHWYWKTKLSKWRRFKSRMWWCWTTRPRFWTPFSFRSLSKVLKIYRTVCCFFSTAFEQFTTLIISPEHSFLKGVTHLVHIFGNM